MARRPAYGCCTDCGGITDGVQAGEWVCGRCQQTRTEFAARSVKEYDQLANVNRLRVIYAHRGGRY